MIEWIISPEDSGKKLISFLVDKLGQQYAARALKRILEGNGCRINGRTERFASALIGSGDHIQLNLTAFSTAESMLSLEISRVLYEDEDFLIYDKPAGINSDEKGILQLLKPSYPSLQLVHRLDRYTTGVLILAKNAWIFNQMLQAFKELRIQKCYMAIVDRVIAKKKGSIDNYLGKKHSYNGQTIWGAVNKSQGLHAHTDWIKMQEGEEATWISCFPKTGRTHQIRVHLAESGHPILGDFQYCKQFRCSYSPKRYLLHAQSISFQHPRTGKMVKVEAPIPEDFKECLRSCFHL